MSTAPDKSFTKSNGNDGLADLKILLQRDEILSRYYFDDHILTRFLLSSDFNLSSTVNKIREYHYVMDHNPNWFVLPLSHELRREDVHIAFVINDCDNEDRGILILKIRKLNVQLTTLEKQISLFHSVIEAFTMEPNPLHNGINLIIDVNGLPWKLMQWLTPSNIKAGVKLVDNYPIKDIIIHIVNKSHILQIMLNIVWPFLSDHLKQLIKFHFTNWESLHEYINPNVLPREYGGSGPDCEELAEYFLETADYLKDSFQKRVYLHKVTSDVNIN